MTPGSPATRPSSQHARPPASCHPAPRPWTRWAPKAQAAAPSALSSSMRWTSFPATWPHALHRPHHPSQPAWTMPSRRRAVSWACRGPCSSTTSTTTTISLTSMRTCPMGPSKTLTQTRWAQGIGDPHPRALLLSPPRGPRFLPQSLLGLRMRGHWEMGPLPLGPARLAVPHPHPPPRSRPLGTPWSISYLRKMPLLAPQTLSSPACLGPPLLSAWRRLLPLGARTRSWEWRTARACRPLPGGRGPMRFLMMRKP